MPTELSYHPAIMMQSPATQLDLAFIHFPIVALGVGDIDALQRFLAATPAPSDAAFIVVTRRQPHEEPTLFHRLQPYTRLLVQQVTEMTRVEQNRVYVIPATHTLIGLDTHFHLAPLTKASPAPVDRCFQTLAQAARMHAVDAPISAVILAGTGVDGAQGLSHVKAAGGLTAMQDPLDFNADGLPMQAIAPEEVDLVMPAAELPTKVLEYTKHRPQHPLSPTAPPLETEQSLQPIIDAVKAQVDQDFSHYAPAWLLSRVERRMRLLGDSDLAQYTQRLVAKPHEAYTLRKDWLSSASHFFHPPEAFDRFSREIIPRLFHGKRADDQVRIWVVGCASGEEVYSLTLLLLDYRARLAEPPELRIFATDVNQEALRRARAGFYPETIAADVTPEHLARYFTQEASGYRLRDEVRDQIIFAEHDLLQAPPFTKLELIVCRALLPLLQSAMQDQLLQFFHFLLQPHGYLWLGGQEEMSRADLFNLVQPAVGLYRRASTARSVWPFPLGKRYQLLDEQTTLPSLRRPADADSYEAIYTNHLEQQGPPGLLVDRDQQIVYYSTGVAPYLHQPSGEATDHVLKRVLSPFHALLTTGLYRALQKGETFQSHLIELQTEAGQRQVRLRISPAGRMTQTAFASVLFLESETPVALPAPQDAALAPRLRELERALALKQEQLEATEEEYRTTKEEMMAAQDELMALNEELILKAAELEHSKAELQSANEELLTINQENRKNITDLRQLTANLQNLMVATDIATLFLDRALRVRWLTPRIREIFNLLPADEGRPLAHITHHLEYPDLVRDAGNVLHTLTPHETETGSKTGRWYFIRLLPYRTIDQVVDGVVLTFFDITARKQAEDALRQLNTTLEHRVEERTKELTRSNQELDQFAYIASHDLKAPLRAIHNLAQWIEEDAAAVLPKESKGHLAKLHSRVKRMGRLIDDLLTYSRAGRHLHKPEWVDTAKLVDDLRFFLAPPHGFRIEILGALPKIYTERVPLETVLRNLIDNAVKHHHQPEQGVLQISAQAQAAWTEFTLTDNGPGIAPQYHDRIFQVFQGLKPREEVEGSGMGLAVVKKAVETRGGHVQVESDVGQGTTFRFTWPNLEVSESEQ